MTTMMNAKASLAAYGDSDAIANLAAENGPVIEVSHSLHGAHAVVSVGRSIVIAFRGTQPQRLSEGTMLTDILADITIIPNQEGIHTGFNVYVNLLLDDLDVEMKKALRGGANRPIFVTGHSLGGAMAQIYAFHVIKTYRKRPIVFAFDSPACFSSQKAAEFNATFPQSWRVYIQGDPVVRLLNAIYTHTARFAEVSSDGLIKYTESGILESSLQHQIETLIEYLNIAMEGSLFHFYIL